MTSKANRNSNRPMSLANPFKFFSGIVLAYRLRRIWRQKCRLFCCRWAVCGGSGYGCRPLNCDISGRSGRPARPDRPAAPRGAGHVLPGGGRPRRRGMPLPYKPSGDDRSSGKARTPRTTVGRDALIPPDPAAGRTFRFWNRRGAAGVNARPTGRGKPRGEPEKRSPALLQPL